MPLVFIIIGAVLLAFGSGNISKEETKEEKVDSFTKFDSLFKKYGEQFKIEWRLLKAICMNESSLGENPRVKSGGVSEDGKSWGIMQLTLPTANDFEPASIERLNDPDFSIRVAAKFLRSLSKQFSGDTRSMVMAYNQGAGNQKKFLLAEKEGRLTPTIYTAAREYYERFKRNYNKVVEKQG